ncbi:small integral membrane protein 8-like isoform X2 [Teleopsis dalmanni]|uniref:small integral membrane protein 8-like isoform X2 n=1 Tax=Teleopsis dalmanni TaxID=139649 RepID=UPI0018CD7CAF|nr:small integral membrane protein 8-like isoform X2 [Teleopsis dalmanni]XP_037929973.1 small integral membrane protein 8-like isoform X2 [Teleopsis dalmanni]XP_037935470.1 small integral membrane protein 8-like isoform X2 [Teleopsis dalmanni]
MEKPDNVKTNMSTPGDGIRAVRTTSVFRLLNFELYAKPNKIIMGVGIACFAGVLGYITYMRSKYEDLGYYAAVQDDGKETFTKKVSNWEK